MPHPHLLESRYIGRFAPSPSGPLHLGSLCCALASYLDAKAHNGKWLVRIEDIDPPREEAGADQLILETLQQHQLYWDEEVRYQSQQGKLYRKTLKHLHETGLSYPCTCTRKRLQTLKGGYDGHCRNKKPEIDTPSSIRLNTSMPNVCKNAKLSFTDIIQGKVQEDISKTGDFIIHRKDGLFAYQLAVSCDDIDQGITHVVRGCDLLETTAKQQLLIKTLNAKVPLYAHIPVIAERSGFKLSKQNHATAVDNLQAFKNLKLACIALNIVVPTHIDKIESLLLWAQSQWSCSKLTGKKEILQSELEALL